MESLQKMTALNKNLSERVSEETPCTPEEKICLDFSQFLSDKTCPKCQDGWEQLGIRCYNFAKDFLPWEDARRKCQREQGDLVQIDSTEEQAFLVKELSRRMEKNTDLFWIGLTDSKKEGSWLWVDGSPLNPSLAFWAPREPDDWKYENPDGEDCARMGDLSRPNSMKWWFDKSCKASHKHVCEKPAEDIGRLKCH